MSSFNNSYVGHNVETSIDIPKERKEIKHFKHLLQFN